MKPRKQRKYLEDLVEDYRQGRRMDAPAAEIIPVLLERIQTLRGLEKRQGE